MEGVLVEDVLMEGVLMEGGLVEGILKDGAYEVATRKRPLGKHMYGGGGFYRKHIQDGDLCLIFFLDIPTLYARRESRYGFSV